MNTLFYSDSLANNGNKHGLNYSVAIFISLIVLELMLIVAISGLIPNRISSPFMEFIPTFMIIWTDNWYLSLKLLFSHTFAVVSHLDPRSDLNLWTIAYYPVSLFIYALAALLAGYNINSNISAWQKIQVFCALIITAISVTYVSMIEHCSGPTWVLQVMFLDKTSILYHPKIYWFLLTSNSEVWIYAAQWLFALLGGAWLVRLLLIKRDNYNKDHFLLR